MKKKIIASQQGVFRSKLEAYCESKLAEKGIPHTYEKVKFILLPSFKYTGKSVEKVGKKEFKQQNSGIRPITYTPDFVGDDWIIECKGHFRPEARIKWKMFKYHLLTNNIQVDLYMPSNQKEVDRVIDEILNTNKNV